MKTLKKDKHTAYVVANTVYMSNNEKIYKQFGLSTFNSTGWGEIESPSDEELLKLITEFNISNASKEAERLINKAKREEAYKLQMITERDERKEFLLNLRKWRQEKIEVYLISTKQQYAGEYGNCKNPWDFENVIVFGKENAIAKFNELKESCEPDGNGIEFVTELLGINNNVDMIEVVSRKELIDFIYNYADSIEYNAYAPTIPDGSVIITLYHGQHGSTGSFRDAHYPNKTPFWMGDCRIEAEETTADLKPFEDHSFTTYEKYMPMAEAIEEYREKVIERLQITKEEAISAGTADYLIDELFIGEEIEEN